MWKWREAGEGALPTVNRSGGPSTKQPWASPRASSWGRGPGPVSVPSNPAQGFSPGILNQLEDEGSSCAVFTCVWGVGILAQGENEA